MMGVVRAGLFELDVQRLKGKRTSLCIGDRDAPRGSDGSKVLLESCASNHGGRAFVPRFQQALRLCGEIRLDVRTNEVTFTVRTPW